MKRVPNSKKKHFIYSNRQENNWVPLPKCVFCAFQTKCFFDFLKEGMRLNVEHTKCSD